MNYVLLILIPTLFYYVDRLANSRSHIFEKLGITFLVVFTSLRVNLGADYLTYESAFYRIKAGINTDNFGYGYFILNKIVGDLGGNFHVLLLVVGIINGILIYFILKDNVVKEYRWLAIFIFLGYFDLYVYMLSAIRQSIAIYICMFSIRYIYSNKPVKYTIFIFIAYLFHWTAIIMVPCYFLYKYLLKATVKNTITTILLLIPLYFIIMKFSALFATLSPRLNYYLVLDDSAAGKSVIVILGAAVGILLWNFFLYKYNISYYSYIRRIDKSMNIISIPEASLSIFLASKIMQNLYYLGALPRIQVYFYCFIPIAGITALQRVNSRWRFVTIIALILLIIVEFYFKVQLNSQYYLHFQTLLN